MSLVISSCGVELRPGPGLTKGHQRVRLMGPRRRVLFLGEVGGKKDQSLVRSRPLILLWGFLQEHSRSFVLPLAFRELPSGAPEVAVRSGTHLSRKL